MRIPLHQMSVSFSRRLPLSVCVWGIWERKVWGEWIQRWYRDVLWMSGLLPYGSELLVELPNGKRNVAFSTQCHSKNNSAPQIIWQELEGNVECHTFRLSIWQATSNFFGHLPNRRLWYWMLTASTGFVVIGQRAGSWGLTIDAGVCMDTCSGGTHGCGSIMLVDLVQLLFR